MGSGLIFLTVANGFWILSGFVIHFGLGRLLGPVAYGTFGIINAFISIYYLILSSGVRRAVAKLGAGAAEQAADVKIAGLKVQAVIAGILVALSYFGAPVIARWLNDPALTLYLRYSTLIIPIAGVFFVLVGYLDSCKQFISSASALFVYSFIRVTAVFFLVYLGFEIIGVVTGLIVSITGGACIAVYLGRGGTKSAKFEVAKITQFAVPVFCVAAAVSFLSHVDLFILKSMVGDGIKIGGYAAAQALSKLITFALFPFGLVLLPTISRTIAANDSVSAQRYIRKGLHYLLILLIPGTIFLSSTAEPLIRIIYGTAYSDGADALRILIIGTSCWALVNTLVSILQGFGRPWVPAVIFSLLIPLSLLLQFYCIPIWGLRGAAMATTLTFFISTILCGAVLHRRVPQMVSYKSCLQILIASLSVAIFPLAVELEGMYLICFYPLGFCIYLVVLWLIGVIAQDDLYFLKETISRSVRLKSTRTGLRNAA